MEKGNRNFLLAVFIFFNATVSIYPQETEKAILAGKMIDVVEGRVKKNILIIVEKGKIVKIKSAAEKDKYPNLIDLSEYTVLPGLIDCHTHQTNPFSEKSIDPYELPIASYGILGTINAKRTIDAGFTTVRDVGAVFYSDVALRDAINKGWIPGPRMYVSGKSLSITGGHGAWANWLAPHLRIEPNPGNIVDGEVEVRRSVRALIKNNVDLIKLNATGGFGTSRSIPGASSFTIEEMHAAVEEAEKVGLKVAAHAHGADGIKNAIKAGVHSIEHGTFLDDESIELLKKYNVYLVMDILAAHYDLIETKQDFSNKKISQTNEQQYKSYVENLAKAYDKGVKLAFGTDASIYPHGRNAEQFRLMKNAGMKSEDILKTATINAAELIGIGEKTGSIEVGKWADIIAVKGNPFEDISVLERVLFVMKDGKVYKFEK